MIDEIDMLWEQVWNDPKFVTKYENSVSLIELPDSINYTVTKDKICFDIYDLKWCIDNCKGRFFRYRYKLVFELKEDLIFFKLLRYS